MSVEVGREWRAGRERRERKNLSIKRADECGAIDLRGQEIGGKLSFKYPAQTKGGSRPGIQLPVTAIHTNDEGQRMSSYVQERKQQERVRR